jgi:hypothetical protein
MTGSAALPLVADDRFKAEGGASDQFNSSAIASLSAQTMTFCDNATSQKRGSRSCDHASTDDRGLTLLGEIEVTNANL